VVAWILGGVFSLVTAPTLRAQATTTWIQAGITASFGSGASGRSLAGGLELTLGMRGIWGLQVGGVCCGSHGDSRWSAASGADVLTEAQGVTMLYAGLMHVSSLGSWRHPPTLHLGAAYYRLDRTVTTAMWDPVTGQPFANFMERARRYGPGLSVGVALPLVQPSARFALAILARADVVAGKSVSPPPSQSYVRFGPQGWAIYPMFTLAGSVRLSRR
jgi:hypothetical protein